MNAPLVEMIVRALGSSAGGSLHDGFFRDLLRRRYLSDEADRQLAIAIDWGRYGEIFECDADDRRLTLTPAARQPTDSGRRS